MKTSATQFEMIVNFMEEHVDILKPTSMARGKKRALQLWEKLINLLNNDPSGPGKDTEKWKKVGKDLKNNTKKKAAKINSLTGAGGGTATWLTLTALEQKGGRQA